MPETLQLLLAAVFKLRLYDLREVPDDPWVVVASDISIAVAHFAIVLVFVLILLKRKDSFAVYSAILFGVFIGFRGLTSALSIWTIWNPRYQLSYELKTCTTLLSVMTAAVLIWRLPALRRLPSAAQLRQEVEQRRKAEEAVREKEERFRNFVETVQDYAMYMVDLKGIIQTWNSGAEKIKGYTAEEVVGKHFSIFFTAEDRARNQPADALAVARDGGSYIAEGWRLRKDGSRFWARVSLRPLRDAAGEMCGFAMITRDLTGAREIEAKYQTLLEAAPDAILIADRGGLLRFVNAQGEKLFGYTRAELMGTSIDLLTPERNRLEQSRYREQLFASSVNGSVADPSAGSSSGPSPDPPVAPAESRGQRKDGSEFCLEFSLSPLDTNEGRVFLFALRDVTARNKSETRFRSLLDSAPDAMVIVDSGGKIELANKQTERLFGYTGLELAGHSVDILIPTNLRGGHVEHRRRFSGTPRHREMGAGLNLEAVRKDGSTFPVEISLSPLEGPDGMSVTAAIRDITERRIAAQQLAEKMTELRQSNEALEQFAHIASHDLQEPLRMVASYTQLLAKRYKGRLDADADEFIEFAVDGTRRMKALIEDLLLYSRAGRDAPPLSEVSSDLCLQEALNNLFAIIHESQAVVTHGELPTVYGVESQLVQVFQNLVGNAIKYRGTRIPEIHVVAEQVDKEWIFAVRDNGIGIEPRYFDRIFVIFQRLHAGNEYSGTGIGLAICKRTLQQQGGRIWLESEVGRGSTFYFAIPTR